MESPLRSSTTSVEHVAEIFYRNGGVLASNFHHNGGTLPPIFYANGGRSIASRIGLTRDVTIWIPIDGRCSAEVVRVEDPVIYTCPVDLAALRWHDGRLAR